MRSAGCGVQGAKCDAALVSRAMAVKVKIIEADPYEQGIRAALNLGHTFPTRLRLLKSALLKLA